MQIHPQSVDKVKALPDAEKVCKARKQICRQGRLHYSSRDTQRFAIATSPRGFFKSQRGAAEACKAVFGAFNVSNRRLQMQLTQQAKIPAILSSFAGIFAFAGFVSGLRGESAMQIHPLLSTLWRWLCA